MVLIYTEVQDGKVKKSALESVFYGSKVAASTGTTCVALILGHADDASRLGGFGANEVWEINNSKLA